MLKSLSIAKPVEVVKEETQVAFMNSRGITVFLIPLASNMSPKTQLNSLAQTFRYARTAPGHHAQLVRPAKISAGQSSTRATMSASTTLSARRTT